MKTLMTMALAACAALVGAAEPQPGKIDFNVRDYGGSVAKAAAAAAQAGGGRIVVPPGVWKIIAGDCLHMIFTPVRPSNTMRSTAPFAVSAAPAEAGQE